LRFFSQTQKGVATFIQVLFHKKIASLSVSLSRVVSGELATWFFLSELESRMYNRRGKGLATLEMACAVRVHLGHPTAYHLSSSRCVVHESGAPFEEAPSRFQITEQQQQKKDERNNSHGAPPSAATMQCTTTNKKLWQRR